MSSSDGFITSFFYIHVKDENQLEEAKKSFEELVAEAGYPVSLLISETLSGFRALVWFDDQTYTSATDEFLADLAGWAKGRDCSGYFAVEVDVNNYYRVGIENGSVSWTNVEWILAVPGDKQVLLQEMAQFSYSELEDALIYLKTGSTI